MNGNDGRYTETDRLPPIRHESSKKDIPSPAPSAAPARNHPRTPANLDLFPYEASARPVAGLAVDYEDGHRVRRHRHRRAQLLYAISGVMVVETEAGIWVVPPTRGVWVPAWVAHGIRMSGEPRMRTVFVEPGAAARLPTQCCVLSISPLLRELMAAATEVPLDWQPGTRDGRLMMLLLDELRQEPVLPLHLPQPAEPRLARICRAIVRHPERQDGVADWALELGVDPKTVQRLFLRHTGMTFGRWRQRYAAAGGDGTAGARRAGAGRGAGPGLRVRAPSRPCSARPWASRPAPSRRAGASA